MTLRSDLGSLLGVSIFILLVHLSSCEVMIDQEGPGANKGNFSCYVCNSYYSPTCADHFNNRSWELIPCSPEERMCRKIVQEAWYEDSWNIRYIRQCAQNGKVGYDEGRRCKDRVGTYRIKMRYCYCDNKDGCNGAPQLALTTSAIVVPLLVGLFRVVG